MTVSKVPHLPIENQILAALSAAEYQRLVPHLERVDLESHKVLYEAGEPITHVYFLNQAIASLVCIFRGRQAPPKLYLQRFWRFSALTKIVGLLTTDSL